MADVTMTTHEGTGPLMRLPGGTYGRGTVTVLTNGTATFTVQRGYGWDSRPCWTVESADYMGCWHEAKTRRECIDVAMRLLDGAR